MGSHKSLVLKMTNNNALFIYINIVKNINKLTK